MKTKASLTPAGIGVGMSRIDYYNMLSEQDFSLENARRNIVQFVEDLRLKDVVYIEPDPQGDEDGYCYGYKLIYKNRSTVVSMSALPLEEVRYIDEKKQRISQFPRLSVDGSSWVWFFALRVVKDVFMSEPEAIQSKVIVMNQGDMIDEMHRKYDVAGEN